MNIANQVNTLRSNIDAAQKSLIQMREVLAKLRAKNMKAVASEQLSGTSYALTFNGRTLTARAIMSNVSDEAYRVTEKGRGVVVPEFRGNLGDLRFEIAIGNI